MNNLKLQIEKQFLKERENNSKLNNKYTKTTYRKILNLGTMY